MKNLYVITLGLLISTNSIFSAEQYSSLSAASERRETSSCLNRKTRIGLALSALMGTAVTLGFGVNWNKDQFEPLQKFPEGEGPSLTSCYYADFNEWTIRPTCHKLNESTPGVDACPSYVKKEFGAYSDLPEPHGQAICEHVKLQYCVTDDQIKTYLPRWCRTHFGKKSIQRNETVQRKSNATRKHLQRVMFRNSKIK